MPDKYFIVYNLGSEYSIEVKYTYHNEKAPAGTIAYFDRYFTLVLKKDELTDFVQLLLDYGFTDLTQEGEE